MALIEIKAIKPTTERVVPNLEEIMREELERAGEDAQKRFEKTVRTWKKKPEFEVLEDVEFALVGTDSEIYGYVDKGTRAHTIRPKRAKALRFQAGHTAKTRPNFIGSRGGGSRPPTVFAQRVRHPGTKARNFSKIIARQVDKRFQSRVNRRVKRAIRDINKGRQ